MAAATTYEVTSLDRPGPPSPEASGARAARRLDRRQRLAVLAPAVLMLVVGFVGLDRHSMWRDEAASLVAARRTSGELVTLLAHADTVHALYYTLLHGWLSLLPGSGVVWARVPSVLAMAVAVGLVGVVAARLASVGVGVLAGLLLVVNPATSFYAQEARSPALVTATALLAAWCLLNAVRRTRRARTWWVAYGLACAVLVALNLLAVLVPLALAVTLVVWRRPRRALRLWARATAPAVLVVVALVAVVHRQQPQIGWIPSPGLGSLRDLAHLVLGGSVPAVLLAAPLVLVGALPRSRPGRFGWSGGPSRAGLQALALPLLVLPPATLLLASLVSPVFVPRYVVPSAAGAALLAGVGVARLARLVADRVAGSRPQGSDRGPATARRVVVLVAAALLVLLTVADLGAQRLERTPLSRPDDLEGVAAAVAAGARPGDALLFLPDNRRLVAEVYPGSFAALDDVALADGPEATGTLTGRAYPLDRVLTRLGSASRVWVVGRPALRLNPAETTSRAELALLDRDFVRTAAPSVHGFAVVLFLRRGTV